MTEKDLRKGACFTSPKILPYSPEDWRYSFYQVVSWDKKSIHFKTYQFVDDSHKKHKQPTPSTAR